MLKYFPAAALVLMAGTAQAQQPSGAPAARSAPRAEAATACPRGTVYAMIRHTLVKPGKWAEFEQAVAAHKAWYAAKGSATAITMVRVVDQRGDRPGLSASEAVTVARYAGRQPQHDAGYAAFTAKYKASGSIRDEARVCLPAL